MLTRKDINNRFKKHGNGRLKALKFTGIKEPCILYDQKCGKSWKVSSPMNYMYKKIKHPCPFCAHNNRTLSNSTFLKRMKIWNKKFNHNYKPLTICKGSHKPVKVIDLNDEHIWWTTPHELGAGYSYKKVGVNIKYTSKQFQDKLNKIFGTNHIILLSKYNGRTHKVLVHCNKHNYTWKCWPGNLLKGHGCPRNVKGTWGSYGEAMFESILVMGGVSKAIHSYPLNNSGKKNHMLRLDFYLPNKHITYKGRDYTSGTGIEIDGVQHRRPVKHFGGVKRYLRQKEEDTRKEIYCYEHKIFLIRIPYHNASSVKPYIKNCKRILSKYGIIK